MSAIESFIQFVADVRYPDIDVDVYFKSTDWVVYGLPTPDYDKPLITIDPGHYTNTLSSKGCLIQETFVNISIWFDTIDGELDAMREADKVKTQLEKTLHNSVVCGYAIEVQGDVFQRDPHGKGRVIITCRIY